MTRDGCAQLWHVLQDPVMPGWHFSKVGLNSIVSKRVSQNREATFGTLPGPITIHRIDLKPGADA